MSKKTKWTKQQKEEVSFWVEKYKKILFLEGWKISVVFLDDMEELAATCTSSYEYREATICIYHKIFSEDCLDVLQDVILHEMCHIVTLPLAHKAHNLLDGVLVLKKDIDFINEQTTSWVEAIVSNLLQCKKDL